MLGTGVVPIDLELAVGLLLDDGDREMVDLALALGPVKGVEIQLGCGLVGVGRDATVTGLLDMMWVLSMVGAPRTCGIAWTPAPSAGWGRTRRTLHGPPVATIWQSPKADIAHGGGFPTPPNELGFGS